MKSFEGGLYAVTGCIGVRNIGQTWRELSRWVENSEHDIGSHQWLEEHLEPIDSSQDEERLELDLYFPIVS